MKPKPSRTFVYLALMMVFLLVLGLVVVGMLASSNTPSLDEDFGTRPAILATNSALAATAQIQAQTFTPIPYTADMSPTAVPPESLISSTPTAPYPFETAQWRRTEVWLLMTSGGPDDYASFYATETALVSAYQTVQSSTVTASPTGQAQAGSFTQCAFSWAHRDLPDVAVLAQVALDKTDIPHTTVRADAYGEECSSPNSQTVGFSAMTTDFYLTVEFPDLTDQAALFDYITTVYNALLALPSDSLPATQGYLDITVTSGGTTQHLRTMFATVKSALKQQLTGAAFFEALGGLQ